ncbi:MAG: hypothetical protein O0X93_01675 [Methanocorpusculum sp.]|nr:hypothetical protein [Methanocorpusculum sp.]MDE2521854.1 hypothetical protein [Methanocorpusculum sp.]MDE2524847.1 hypothetical protein [Methanocorpusculum sp.]
MVTKIVLWSLIDKVHRDYNERHLTYKEAMIYLDAYAAVAAVGPEKSRSVLADRIERVRKWITELYEVRHE